MTIKSGAPLMALALAVGLVANPLQAQTGRMGRGEGSPNRGGSLELILQHHEDLNLTADQVSQLEALKITEDNEVAPLVEEMEALREKILSGDVDREDGIRRMKVLRGQLVPAKTSLRGRVQEILTVEQVGRLQAIVRVLST